MAERSPLCGGGTTTPFSTLLAGIDAAAAGQAETREGQTPEPLVAEGRDDQVLVAASEEAGSDKSLDASMPERTPAEPGRGEGVRALPRSVSGRAVRPACVELGSIGGGEPPDHDSVRYVGSSGRRRGLEVEHSLVGAHVVERLGQQRQKAFRGFDAVVREWGQGRGGKCPGVARQGGTPAAGDGDGTGPGRVVAPRPPGSCGEDVLHQRGGPWGAGQEQRLTDWGERDCAQGHANSGDVRVKQVRPRGGGRTWCQR